MITKMVMKNDNYDDYGATDNDGNHYDDEFEMMMQSIMIMMMGF